ncbi:restin homolog isoform X1 [Hermetia illucens]|nr:restin homolog isoform X1 [Hermetia illucens]
MSQPENNSLDIHPLNNSQHFDTEIPKSHLDGPFSLPSVQHSPSIQSNKNVCDEILDNKMAALEVNDALISENNVKGACGAGGGGGGDGSDSGVDIAINSNLGLQRALSSTSAGYASSCCCIDEPHHGEGGGNFSCDSSVISYSSDVCENNKTVSTVMSQNSNLECTSENGSESSSVAGGPIVRKASIVKKKELSPRKAADIMSVSTPSLGKSRSRAGSSVRHLVTPKSCGAPILQTKERARSREKTPGLQTASSKSITPPYRSTPVKRPALPTSLSNSSSMQRFSSLTRTPSLSRARTPVTPTDDGRWPSVGGRGMTMNQKRAGSAVPDLSAIKSRVNMIENKSSSPIDKYATLPRRRKQKSFEDLRGGRSSRSSSASRENKLSASSVTPPSKKTPTPPSQKSLPPFLKTRKLVPRTKIYHEISVQTAITGEDVQKAFAGSAKTIKVDAIEISNKETQSDIRDKEIESLNEQLRALNENYKELRTKLCERKRMVVNMEQQLNRERKERLAAQAELHLNTERVIGMLELTRGTPTEEEGFDSLLMLESQIQMSGHELEEKQQEISKLRTICRTLQREMERSLAAQEALAQQKATIEKESSELQDFLQTEKLVMYDSLREMEVENAELKKLVDEKSLEIMRLRDECRHLVRVNEQRRQENKGMQTKYTALECRSKELIVQQNSAVSGASMALSGLNSRLDNLVEQLISSYNISEQDLEDVVFHNEAYTNSASSGEGSPECETAAIAIKGGDQNDGSLSPQRNQSFIAAVISAIRSATTSGKKLTRVRKLTEERNGEESDSTEMLDSETEPCLMMDNVLEDVPMHDSHSHNMVSSAGMISQIDNSLNAVSQGDESLHNLSQAIANRQQLELQINSLAAVQKSALLRHQSENSTSEDISGHDSIAEMPSISEYCSAQALVDQVIEVDNLVTKLLKVLRLIQMDNDNCIQQLITDKNKLQLNKEEMLEKLKELDDRNNKLTDELMDVTQQLILKGNDLATNKTELQRHRNEIDRLNQDICNLSTLCSQSRQLKKQRHLQQQEYDNYNQNEPELVKTISRDELLTSLRRWQESGHLPEPEIIAHIVAACNEISNIREMHISASNSNPGNSCLYQLPTAWQQNAIRETKRQYEAIDRALEVLNGLQSLVEQCPALAKLQQDLEETNFKSAGVIPMYTTVLTGISPDQDIEEDVNANESPTLSSNGNQTQINSPA